MKKWLLFGLFLHASTAYAEDTGLSKCSEMKGSIERLQCFDGLVKSKGAESPVTAQVETKSDWEVQTETSKIDDSQNVRMVVESSDSFPGRFGGQEKATLAIYCRERKTDVFLIFGQHFMADNEAWGDVTVRIDKRPATKIAMTESDDHTALGLWGGTGVKFARSLYGATTLLVKASPFNDTSITTEFNVSGLKEAILPLAKACKWPAK